MREPPPLMPKSTYLTRKLLKKYGGPTKGCPACEVTMGGSWRSGGAHTEECRRRIEKNMLQTAEGARKVEQAKDKKREFWRTQNQEPKQSEPAQESSKEEGGAAASSSSTLADSWEQVGDRWIRHHLVPRKYLFHPEDAPGGPSSHSLTSRRETMMFTPDGGSDSVEDRWIGEDSIRSEWPHYWTGRTSFEVKGGKRDRKRRADRRAEDTRQMKPRKGGRVR